MAIAGPCSQRAPVTSRLHGTLNHFACGLAGCLRSVLQVSVTTRPPSDSAGRRHPHGEQGWEGEARVLSEVVGLISVRVGVGVGGENHLLQ